MKTGDLGKTNPVELEGVLTRTKRQEKEAEQV
jgi:hypothetical protein